MSFHKEGFGFTKGFSIIVCRCCLLCRSYIIILTCILSSQVTMSKKQCQNDSSETTELDFLNPGKHTRFQVNRVKSEHENPGNTHIEIKVDAEVQTDDEDNDIHSVTDKTRLNTEYAKSFR